MFIYLIQTDDQGFDTYSGAVVIARNPQAARETWLACFDSLDRKPSISNVVEIGKTTKRAGVVLTSFHAG